VFPIHDIVFLNHRQSLSIRYLVPHHDEHQRPAAPLLFFDVDYASLSRHLIPDPKRMTKLESAPSPHTPWQRDGWQQPAAPRVAIGTQFRSSVPIQEKQPVPQQRQWIAWPRLRILAVERRR
jgi:hypothetical protein